MQDNNLKKHIKLFPIMAIYYAFALYFGIDTKMYFFFYSFISPCLVYTFYKNDVRTFRYGTVGVLLASFFMVNYSGKVALVFYVIMAFLCVLIIEKMGNNQFKNLITFILTMIILVLLSFFVLEKLSNSPSFFEILNKTFTDKESINQINKIIQSNMGKDAIDFTSIDRDNLKLAISSFISIFIFDIVGFVSAINFWIIAHIMAARKNSVPKVGKFSEMKISKKFILIIFTMLLVSFVLDSTLGMFGSGLVLTFIVLLFQIYALQGIFVIDFFLKKTKIPKIFRILILVVGIMGLILINIGPFLLFNLGIIDGIFNLRKLKRGKNERYR